MYKDPVVEEVRRHRQAHARRFNFDIHAIIEDIREQQRKSGVKGVTLPPKLVRKPSTKKRA